MDFVWGSGTLCDERMWTLFGAQAFCVMRECGFCVGLRHFV